MAATIHATGLPNRSLLSPLCLSSHPFPLSRCLFSSSTFLLQTSCSRSLSSPKFKPLTCVHSFIVPPSKPSPSPSPSTSQFLKQPPGYQLSPTAHSSPFDKFVKSLRLSGRYGDLKQARAVHASILKFEQDTRLANALLMAYLELDILSDAYAVFKGLSSPDVASYSAMISAFGKSGYEFDAIELFFKMRMSGAEPNGFTFVAVLTACTRILGIDLGVQLHSLIIKSGYVYSTFVANALIDLYGKCGRLDEAVKVFDNMPERDIASWNTVLASVVSELMDERAIDLFREMKATDGLRADNFTISTLLIACAGCLAQKLGKELHGHALKIGLESTLSVNNALIGFYSKCGGVKEVQGLFKSIPIKNTFTWTGMITALMKFGVVDLALQIFTEMPDKNPVAFNAVLSGLSQNGEGLMVWALFCIMVMKGVSLTDFSLTSVISGCSLLGEREKSEQIHAFVLKVGFGSNDCIETALLDMCTRCGRMADAQKLFQQRVSSRSCSVAWTSMFYAYGQIGMPEKSISLLQKGLLEESIVLDQVALITLIDVCGTLGFTELGEQLHCYILKSGYLNHLGVGNALVGMYSKCGHIQGTLKVFNSLPARDVVTWNGLISGYNLHRQGDEALAALSRMQEALIKPDPITFVLVISSYKYTERNLVDECRRLFLSMRSTYNIDPTSEHYASFVGVLGFWGLLQEAEDTINSMPVEPKAPVWRALLDGSRIHMNTDLGRRICKRILELEPQEPSTFILQSNIYSASGIWHLSETTREEMKRKGFVKHPGRSWVIFQNEIHTFYARDRSHPRSKDIYSGLDILVLECLKAGYVPDTSYVLHEVEEYQKKDFLFYHNAKLAVTQGLLITQSGQPVRVVKNIRLCGDCHNFFKHVSVVTKRDIYLRDNSGFHCFSWGRCSCKDCW